MLSAFARKERLLAATRLGLALSVDLLRASDDPADAPPMVLGFHHLATRDLGARPPSPTLLQTPSSYAESHLCQTRFSSPHELRVRVRS